MTWYGDLCYEIIVWGGRLLNPKCVHQRPNAHNREIIYFNFQAIYPGE